jgi:hypothetical protein
MSAHDEIEAFIAECNRADAKFLNDGADEILRKLYRSDDGATIDLCDEVCDVIRDRQLSLLNRCVKLVPILRKFAQSDY